MVNKSNQSEATFAKHAFLGSFGKGAFKLLKPEDSLEPNHLEYIVKSSDDLVLIAGAMRSIGDILAEQRKKKPDAGVQYTSIKLNEDRLNRFTIFRTGFPNLDHVSFVMIRPRHFQVEYYIDCVLSMFCHSHCYSFLLVHVLYVAGSRAMVITSAFVSSVFIAPGSLSVKAQTPSSPFFMNQVLN